MSETEEPRRPITNGVDVRIFNVGNRGSKLVKFKADRGKGYTAEGVQNLVDGIIEMLDKQFPNEEFDIVRVGDFRYNVVWRSARVAPQCLPVGKS